MLEKGVATPPTKSLLLHVREGVACLTLNRPDSTNCLNGSLTSELRVAVTACESNPAVRAVLLRGNGSSFCAGGDIRAFLQERDNGTLQAFARSVATDLHVAISRLVRMDAPLIVATHGAAAGAGLSLVCAADIVIASHRATFKVAYSAIGVSMDGGLSYFLPRIVGLRRATELSLTNRTLSAREAFELGIVTEIVPEAELNECAEALAVRLAAGPTRAFGRIKALLRNGWQDTLESQLELESRQICEAFGTADAQEGVAAFDEKRQPNFVGE